MKAMVLRKPAPVSESPLQLSEVPLPVPEAGQVRIRVLACGVCHTDRHIVEGELPAVRLPLIPGHQIVGVVEDVSSGASRFVPGQRVGVAWLAEACGECEFCNAGLENLCEKARFTGYHADGGYAQYALVSEDFAYPIPERFPDLQAAPLLCAGVIGLRALRLSGASRGQSLGLFGFGASAHIVIQVARHWGCDVLVFTRGEEHRRLGRELGAVWAGQAGEEPPALLHAAIIFAPAGELAPEALRVLRKGGTVVAAGIHMSPLPQMDYALLYDERSVRSVANSTRQDAQDLLRLAEEIPIRTEIQAFPLEEANRALQLLKAGQIRGAAVLDIANA
jgi:propanol-preferring alcohol dehydrogenase